MTPSGSEIVIQKLNRYKIPFRFADLNGNTSPELAAWFAIAERDDVPRIIGLKDINATHRLIVDAGSGTFSLEF